LKELSKYELDLVEVQEVRWGRSDTKPASKYIFSYGKGDENHELGTGFLFVHERNISAVMRVEFVSDRMYIKTLRGYCCDIIVLNVHAPTEDKPGEVKDGAYEELERVLDKFPK
jgi:hypothetical protein